MRRRIAWIRLNPEHENKRGERERQTRRNHDGIRHNDGGERSRHLQSSVSRSACLRARSNWMSCSSDDAVGALIGAAEAVATLTMSRCRHIRIKTITMPSPSTKATGGMYHAMLLKPVAGGALKTFSPYS